MTQFSLRELLLATLFLAFLLAGVYVHSQIVGFASVPAAVVLLVWILVITCAAALTLQNVFVGIVILLLFYVSLAAHDLIGSNAAASRVLPTVGFAFGVHATYYYFVSILR